MNQWELVPEIAALLCMLGCGFVPNYNWQFESVPNHLLVSLTCINFSLKLHYCHFLPCIFPNLNSFQPCQISQISVPKKFISDINKNFTEAEITSVETLKQTVIETVLRQFISTYLNSVSETVDDSIISGHSCCLVFMHHPVP